MSIKNCPNECTERISSDCILLVIDVQEPWVTCAEKFFPEFRKNLTQLITLFRKRGGKIIHVRADYRFKSWTKEFRMLNPEKPVEVSMESPKFAAEIPGEKVLMKSFFNGFYETNLAEELKTLKAKYVFCAGLITSVCVCHTASGAFAEGYPVYLVHDCCGDRSVRRHENTLKLYCNYMFRSMTIKELELKNLDAHGIE